MSGINISAFHWFLLRTKVNREFKAMRALQQRGFAAALPHEMKTRRRNRHTRSVIHFPVPDFSRYLLTGFPMPVPPWRTLLEDWELSRLIDGPVSITSDGLPTRVRPKAIFDLQVRYGANIYELPPKALGWHQEERPELHQGDTVVIGSWQKAGSANEEFVRSAFCDQVITIDQIEGDKASIVLKLFGSEYTVPVSVDRLAAA